MSQTGQPPSTALCFTLSRCWTPAVEMIASQCERADGVYSTLDQRVEITVLSLDECRLKLLSPVGVPTQGNVKYLPLSSHLSSPLPFFLPHTGD